MDVIWVYCIRSSCSALSMKFSVRITRAGIDGVCVRV